MRHPVVTFLVAASLLVAIAVPATRLHMGQSDFASFPDSIDSVQAVNLLDEKWPEGSTLALQVVVTHADRADTKSAIEDLSSRVLGLDGISEPVQTRPSADGTVALVSYVMSLSRRKTTADAVVGKPKE